MRNTSKDSTTTVKVVCAMLFLLFVFFYVYSFQPEVLEMTQYAWAEGKTHYDHVVGTGVIIIVLSVISFVVALLTSLPQRISSLIYFPALLSLGLMTAVEVDGKSVTTSLAWLIAVPVLFVVFCYVAGMAKRFQPFLLPLRGTSFLSQPWWTNSFLLAGMMLLTMAMGNTDRTLHTRLAVERCCHDRQWDAALEKGLPQYDNDSSLTMLRALALANKNEMGERLFNYEITGGSQSLLPQTDNSACFMLGDGTRLWQTIGIVPRDLSEPVVKIIKRELRRGTVKPVAKDYLLCAYLLDRDLKSFIETLPKYYTIDEKLPQHYREAVILYIKKFNRQVTEEGFHDTAMEADYDDFRSVMRSNRNPDVRNSLLRDAYFGTYWYYYYQKTK